MADPRMADPNQAVRDRVRVRLGLEMDEPRCIIIILQNGGHPEWQTPRMADPNQAVWEDYRIGPPPKVHLSVSIPCKKG